MQYDFFKILKTPAHQQHSVHDDEEILWRPLIVRKKNLEADHFVMFVDVEIDA